MNILIANDDGIQAEGIRRLAQALQKLEMYMWLHQICSAVQAVMR